MSLTFNTLRQFNTLRGAQWDGKPACLDDLSFRAMELGGESGEAVEALLHLLLAVGKSQNVSKKLVRHLTGRVGGIDIQAAQTALAEELADIIICADRVAEVLDINLGKAVVDKFNKTSRKHGLVEIDIDR